MRAVFVPFGKSYSSLVLITLISIAVVTGPLCAQDQVTAGSTAPRPLITQAVDDSQLTVLKGNTHPLARPQFDLGAAPASQPMQRMLLVLKRSDNQEAGLRKLLDGQQDKSSPNYHKWLTPEQFGQQFGPTDADMQTISGWLQSHGFQVGSTKGRTVLEFSGSASQVQAAFHTSIHKYIVNGEEHWANASDPSIPSALAPAVAGIASMNNFPRKPMNVMAGVATRDKTTGKLDLLNSEFTWPGGCVQGLLNNNACEDWLGPYDFATIYDVLPLWNAGINGTGQTIAIVGETNINLQDVTDFRNTFGLVANNPTVILNGPDPGIQGDESEALIDVQWSGAVAPNATVDFVVSASTETTFGVELSAVYIVENNLAPVMSESYGECELGLGTAGNQFFNALWQQAAAQGITVFISAGDGGAAGCDNFNGNGPAIYGLQVSGYASTPYNVAVGGTDFNDFNNPGTYWNTTNDPTTLESAKSYIPESTWNDSCTNAIWVTLGWGANAEAVCNNSQLGDIVPVGGSGGVSACTTPSGSTPASCAGGYTKPSWQSGKGVPADGKRDIPDVSLFASNGFLGSAYSVCQADFQGPCPGTILGFGGTSVSSPAFAGIMALVNQQYGRQGNANYIFYKLATQQPTAFHDVTLGTIAMPCQKGTPNCTTNVSADTYGVLSGYNTTSNYDLATGLGSVDANILVTKWNSVTLLPSTTTLSSVTPTTITHGQAVNFTANVKPTTGTGTPTGLISLEGGPTSGTEGIAAFNLTSGAASGSTELLPGGTYSLTAHYPGDSTYAPSTSTPLSVTVNKENSTPQAFLVTFDSTGRVINGDTNTAVYGSPYILRVNVENAAGQMCAPVATTGATACPTGDVTLTNNGTTLDAGTYVLNTYGYTEDLTVQLPGGTDSVKAVYAGDNSFNTSSSTTAITITPGATWTILCCASTNITVGQTTSVSGGVGASSTGLPPSGTVTFYDNGTVLGTATLGPTGGSGAGGNATLSFAFSTSGPHNITATYAGDSNYSGSASSAIADYAYYATTTTLSASSLNVSPGTSVLLTALVDTTVKNLYPSGTFAFSGPSGVITGTPTITQIKDGSGYSALQATLSVVVNSSGFYSFQYSGDSNYLGGASNSVFISVPDFSVGANTNSLIVPQGQSQTLSINVGTTGGFSNPVTLSCSAGLPPETTCAFNPTQITGVGSSTLTIMTTPVGQFRRRAALEKHGFDWLGILILPVLGICVIGIPSSRRRGVLGAIAAMVMLALLLSCGGSGSGGGGGGGTPNPVPTVTSLSPTQQAAGSSSLQLGIIGTGFVRSSSATYNGTSHAVTYVSSSQLTIALSSADMATQGSFPVVVTNPTPGGGSSTPVNFNLVSGTPTGTFTVSVTGTSGATSHTATFSLVVQ